MGRGLRANDAGVDGKRPHEIEVAIVVDGNNRPSHCVSERELDTHFKRAEEQTGLGGVR
jgi:hypothetical protein